MRVLHLSNTLLSVKSFRLPRINMYKEYNAEVDVYTFFYSKSFSIVKNGDKPKFKYYFEFLKSIIFEKYDIAEIYGIQSAIFIPFIRSKRKKLFLTGLGSPFLGNLLTYWLFKMLVNYSSIFVDMIIVLNNEDEKIISGWTRGRCKVRKYFGENQLPIQSLKYKNNLGVDNSGYKFVGRLVGDKGLKDLIRFSKILSNKIIRVYGSNDPRNPSSASELIDELLSCKNIVLMGHQSFETIFLEDRRPLLVLSRREGLSTVVMEAILTRTPVVGFGVAGVLDIFEAIFITNTRLINSTNIEDLVSIESLAASFDYNLDEAAEMLLNKLQDEFEKRKLEISKVVEASLKLKDE